MTTHLPALYYLLMPDDEAKCRSLAKESLDEKLAVDVRKCFGKYRVEMVEHPEQYTR